jgi:hypothetical protein
VTLAFVKGDEMEDQRKKGGLFGPILLIFVGILFLLNNFGLVSWDIWFQLLRLWPILLVGAGLDLLIGRKSMLGSLVVAVIIVALLGGGLWLIASRPTTGAMVKEVSQSLEGATLADVEIGFGVGTLRIEALPESGELVEGTLDLSDGEKVDQDFYVKDDTAHWTLKSEGSFSFGFSGDWHQDRTWDLKLNRDVPMELSVRTGVGVSTLDLKRFNLTDLDISHGVGKTTVVLPDQGQLKADVSGGVGEVIIEIPEDMAARLRISTGLGGKQVPGNYRRTDDEYVSPGYDSAENRVQLNVSGGVGKITVREHKGE